MRNECAAQTLFPSSSWLRRCLCVFLFSTILVGVVASRLLMGLPRFNGIFLEKGPPFYFLRRCTCTVFEQHS